MNVMEHIREWSTASDEWSEICKLQDHHDTSDPAVATRMAELLEAVADRMDRSGLVRVFASSFTPESLRAEAAEWRSGRNPKDD